jgi:DNA-binding transcriptional MerR regulator
MPEGTAIKKAIHPKSAFFRGAALRPKPQQDFHESITSITHETASYQDTFKVINALEAEVLALEAVYEDSQPTLDSPFGKSLARLKDTSQAYVDAKADIDRKKDTSTSKRTQVELDGENDKLTKVKNIALINYQEARAAYKKFTEASEQRELLALMLYYYSTVLKKHYESYENKEKINKYQSILTKIDNLSGEFNRLKQISLYLDAPFSLEEIKKVNEQFNAEEQKEKDAQNTLCTLIREDATGIYKNVRDGLLRTSKWRDAMSEINMQRIYWIFSHFVIDQLGKMALDIRQHFNWILGNADEFTKEINTPKNFLNILSVALFAIRLVIDFIMIVKHCTNTFCNESEKEVPRLTRLKQELKKRGFDIANNIVWGTANFVTNYNELCHISAPFANYIIAGLLIFDAALVGLRWWKASLEYEDNRLGLLGYLKDLKQKEKETRQSINHLEAELKQLRTADPTKKTALADLKIKLLDIAHHQKITNAELKALEDDWRIKRAVYQYYVGAAALLCASFFITVFAVPPAAVLACYIVGLFAVALYLSGDLFADYKKKNQEYLAAKEQLENPKLPAEQKKELKETMIALKHESDAAFKKLAFSLAEKTIMPTIILIAFASNVIAGAALLAAYMIYKIGMHYHKKHQAKKETPTVNRYGLFSEMNKAKAEDSLEIKDEKKDETKGGKEGAPYIAVSTLPELDMFGAASTIPFACI